MAGLGAGGRLDGFVALLHFGHLILGRHVAQVHALPVARSVIEGVRANLVSFGRRAFHQVNTFAADAVAHGEERGFGAELGQRVEDGGGGVAPGAVIEREGHHFVVADLGRHVVAHGVDGVLQHFFGDEAR